MHKLAKEAFMKVALEGFYLWLDESHPEDSRQVQTCLDEIGTLVDELSKERHNQVFKSRVSQRFPDLFAAGMHCSSPKYQCMAPFQHSGCPI